MPTDPKMLQKIGQKTFKNVIFAKLMLRITFFNFLDVLNVIIRILNAKRNDIDLIFVALLRCRWNLFILENKSDIHP